MTRNKVAILSLSALALLATSVFVASGAQATGAHIADFTCLEEDTTNVHCIGHGEEAKRHNSEQTNHTYSVGFATVTCANTSFNVTTDADGNSTTAPTEPVYENCTSTGGLTTHVDMNNCEYEFHVETNNTDRTAGEEEGEGSADIVGCEGGDATVDITQGGVTRCLIHIPEQTTIKPIRFRNMGGNPTHVTVEAAGAQVTSELTPDGPGSEFADCGILMPTHRKATYNGNTTIEVTSGGAPVDAFIG